MRTRGRHIGLLLVVAYAVSGAITAWMDDPNDDTPPIMAIGMMLLGFAFLGIASLSLVGVTGTVLIMVAHGLLAALTFALSGYIANQINSTKIGSTWSAFK